MAVWAERSVYPYLVALQAIPVLAIVPIIYSIFGGGMSSRVYVCVMIAMFPIVTNTLFGLTSVDQAQHDLFTFAERPYCRGRVRPVHPLRLPQIVVVSRNDQQQIDVRILIRPSVGHG